MRFPSKARDDLEEFRRRSGMSLAALGELVGSDQPAMSRILKGERKPGRALSVRIETETGVPALLWDVSPSEAASADDAGAFRDPSTATGTDGAA